MPDARHALDASAIADLLGLTPAEARVVAALGMGTPLPKAATHLGVTVKTVRYLLSRAMSKTGTKSQVGLVRLAVTALNALPANE
jgi:DNA-binding CsgD family transcriptional regulator